MSVQKQHLIAPTPEDNEDFEKLPVFQDAVQKSRNERRGRTLLRKKELDTWLERACIDMPSIRDEIGGVSYNIAQIKKELDRCEKSCDWDAYECLAEATRHDIDRRTIEEMTQKLWKGTPLIVCRDATFCRYIESSTIGDCDTGYDTTEWWDVAGDFFQGLFLKHDAEYWQVSVLGRISEHPATVRPTVAECARAANPNFPGGDTNVEDDVLSVPPEPIVSLSLLYAERLFVPGWEPGSFWDDKKRVYMPAITTPEDIEDDSRARTLLPYWRGPSVCARIPFKGVEFAVSPRAFLHGEPLALKSPCKNAHAPELQTFCDILNLKIKNVSLVTTEDSLVLYTNGMANTHPKYLRRTPRND